MYSNILESSNIQILYYFFVVIVISCKISLINMKEEEKKGTRSI